MVLNHGNTDRYKKRKTVAFSLKKKKNVYVCTCMNLCAGKLVQNPEEGIKFIGTGVTDAYCCRMGARNRSPVLCKSWKYSSHWDTALASKCRKIETETEIEI